ncbi:hypothetical protein D3C81_1688550 [compost metagenome]
MLERLPRPQLKLDGGGGDHGLWPQRVDADPVVLEFLTHAQSQHAHAVLGDGVGAVLGEPLGGQVQRR